MHKLLLSLAIAGLLGACASKGSRAPTDEDLQAAREQMAESKQEYELCLHDQEEEIDVDCEVFRDIYEEDREAYDILAARRKSMPKAR